MRPRREILEEHFVHATLPLLVHTDFPRPCLQITRQGDDTQHLDDFAVIPAGTQSVRSCSGWARQ